MSKKAEGIVAGCDYHQMLIGGTWQNDATIVTSDFQHNHLFDLA